MADWQMIEDKRGLFAPSYALQVDTGVKDRAGRMVGSKALLSKVDDAWMPERAGQWRLEVYSLRDGQIFGAIPRSTYWTTFEAGKAAGESRVRTAAAKVAREAAKTGGVYLTAGQRKAAAQ